MTWPRRMAVLVAALVPRLVVAWLAFTGVDGIESLRNAVRVLGGTWAHTPYLPFIELWIWIASHLALATPVPLLFAYKLLPLLLDALIGVLLFDATRSLRIGLLYAFAPIPIAIACVTSQWDALWLYFLVLALIFLRATQNAAAGAAFVLSVAAKPVAGPLIILLLPRTRRGALAFIAGCTAAGAVYLAILFAIGWPISKQTILFILEYSQRGVQLFGLPNLPNRLWSALAALAVIAALHFAKRITRDEAVLLFFAATLGLSGLGPQYLAWLIPFALYLGRTRFAAVFTLFAGLFLVLFYRLPLVNRLNIENMGAYGLLKPFGGFAPLPGGEGMRAVALLLGNYAVPLICLTFVAVELTRAILHRRAIDEPALPRPKLAPLLAVAILVGIGTIWTATRPPLRIEEFAMRAEQKIAAYDVVLHRGSRLKMWIPRTGRSGANTATLATIWVIAWSAAAFAWKERAA